MGRFRKLFSFCAALSALSAGDCFAIGFWNGFLSQTNVVECSNYGASTATLELRLRNSVGASLGTREVRLVGYETVHVVLNGIANLTDAYGTYLLSASGGSDISAVRCMTSVYRMSSQAGRAVDYAYVLPVQGALTGTGAGLFNSMNPAGETAPVHNWLTLYNPGNTAFRALIKLYAVDGSLTRETSVELAALERRDLALGHDNPANNFQNIGMYEIVPEDSTAEYFASLVRYGSRNGVYQFAFPLIPSAGSAETRIAFAATVNNALNWAEVANAGTAPADVTIRVRNREGVVLTSEDRSVPAHGQTHFFVNGPLGNDGLGTLEVVPKAGGSKLLLQNLYYGREPGSARLRWAYAAQDNSVRGGSAVRLGFPANTFLGMANWLKLKNADSSARLPRLESFLPAGEKLREEFQPLTAQGAADVPLHERFGTNNVGFTFVSSTDQTAGLQGEVLRVFLGSQGDVLSVMYVPPTPVPEASADIELETVATGLIYPVAVTHAGDGSGRLFISEREGHVRILSGGTVLPTPFLDLSGKITTDGEMGLLSVAFHPDYETNNKFYVAYSETNYDTVFSEFERSAGDVNLADPSSERELLRLPQGTNLFHKGGQLGFGPDGYLYISTGDGGFPGDSVGNAQSIYVYYGKILRIDVSTFPYSIPANNPLVGVPGAREEIWAYGFRNPWRFSFDRANGDLYTGDVGENLSEEIDLVTRGGNYGWNRLEGTRCHQPATGCDTSGTVLPLIEYPHPEGIAVVGGGVYRGTDVPSLVGKYVFGDYATGRIWALDKNERETYVRSELRKENFYMSAFGEDEEGEMYVVNFFGEVAKIISAD